jgi:hypothetical protein
MAWGLVVFKFSRTPQRSEHVGADQKTESSPGVDQQCPCEKSKKPPAWPSALFVTQESTDDDTPSLTEAQIDRIRAVAKERVIAAGEILYEPNDRIAAQLFEENPIA